MTDPVAVLEELANDIRKMEALPYSVQTGFSNSLNRWANRIDAAIAVMRAPVGDGRTYAETCAYSRGYHAGKKAAMQESAK